MTKLRLASAALIGAAVLATPAMARESGRESGVASRYLTENSGARATPGARYIDGRLCYPAPRVGAFATQPWGDGNVPCEPTPGY